MWEFSEHQKQHYMFSLHSFNQYYSDDDIDRFDAMMTIIYEYDLKEFVEYYEYFTNSKDINRDMIDYNKIFDWKVK